MTTLGEHNMKEYNRLFNKDDGWRKSKYKNPDGTEYYIKNVEDDKILADECWRVGKVENPQYIFTLNQKGTVIKRNVRTQR